MNITDMKTNHIENPLGMHMEKARLQWKVREFTGSYTCLAVVRLSLEESMKEVLYEERTSHNNALTIAMPLQPSTRYYWQVEVTDDLGNKTKSPVAWFETAKAEKEWTAQWITPVNQAYRRVGTDFHISRHVKSAVLSISAVGLYEAYIGNKKIGDEYLSPNFNDYEKYIQFQTYHVEEYLQVGDNRIEIWLGNGWYKGRIIHFGGKTYDRYGDKYAAIAELKIVYEDGEETFIYTNSAWKSGKSIILDDSIYDGETIDDNVSDELKSDVRILNLGYERLEARRSIPVKVKMIRSPEKIIHSEKGELILDFGQNMAGWIRFYNRIPKGRTCRITASEILQDGCFYHENMRTAKTEFVYTSDGNKKWVRPHFTYYGFRYVKLEGFGETVDMKDFEADVLFSDMEETGKISTANIKVNKLIENVFWSQRSNFIDVPTDCPQRDERLGWTGDAQIFAGTAALNMDVSAFFSKYMRDMKSEQEKGDGKIPFVIPNVCFGNLTSAAWGDAAAIIPWTMYMMYGDREMLREQYPVMKAWSDYIHSRDLKGGTEGLWDIDNHFGDWLPLDSKACTGATDMHLIATAYYYYSVLLTAKAARELGIQADSDFYGDLASNIRKSFQKEFITDNGRLCSDTQTAHAIVLCMELYRDQEQAERLADRLEDLILENNGFLNTGFIGTHYLCHALSKFKKGRTAYNLLLNESCPGWLYSVCMGATTIWERWDSVLPDGHMNPEGMNSLNHYAYGSVLEWIYRYPGGINPAEAGWKRFTLSPAPDARLGSLDLSYESIYGEIRSSWKYLDKENIKYHFKVPFDTEALLKLPGKEECILHPGEYEYILQAPFGA